MPNPADPRAAAHGSASGPWRAYTRAALPPPDPLAAAHSALLVQRIADEIAVAGGWLRFDRYMALALYAPGLGYYAAGAHKLGDAASGGDFVTAPEISSLFGAALAAQAEQVLAESGPHIVEFGAGSGALADDLLDALAARGVTVRSYLIVEVSADLRERQRRRLQRHPQVRWLDAPPAAFEGLVIANEVLDVMPVRLFVRAPDGVRERGVVLGAAGLAFEDRPADPALTATVAALEHEVGAFAPGYGSEVCEQAPAWTAHLAQWLRRGAALLIDYGFPRREYYHPQRLMGTLMCHYRHHSHAEPLWLPGLNDITAHVDFTAVAEAAHGAGLDVLGYTSQAHFLMNCGILGLLQQQHTPRRAGEVQRLVSEAEMGELFKVLAVGRGINAPLLGFVRGDRRDRL